MKQCLKGGARTRSVLGEDTLAAMWTELRARFKAENPVTKYQANSSGSELASGISF